MGTSLIAPLATHRSISHYVTSLLAPKSHSSRREQNALLIARSSSFFLLAEETTAFFHVLGGLGPRPSALRLIWNPHPLLTMLIDVTQTSMASFGARIPAPLARYHTIVICKGNHIKPSATRSHTQNTTKIPHIGKCPGTLMFYTTTAVFFRSGYRYGTRT